MKKDKQKIIGESLDDTYLKDFLLLSPPAGEDRAFHILIRAYRALRPDDFERFAVFFLEEGLDPNPIGMEGKRFLTVIEQHRYATPYIKALTKQTVTSK